MYINDMSENTQNRLSNLIVVAAYEREFPRQGGIDVSRLIAMEEEGRIQQLECGRWCVTDKRYMEFYEGFFSYEY